ncbi:UNVERIFIED_CONTAM: hypothetical protein GTU68_063218 [Idotea baltica]|nr:hypothetical protein [Idotea baltica]
MLKYIPILAVLFVAVHSQCDDGWESFEDSCYSFQSNSLNWADSRTYCQSLRDGADLAIVKEANTLTGLVQYTDTYSLRGSFWLGGSDLDFEGDWRWIDTSRIEYGTPFWALNHDLLNWDIEPKGGSNENCLDMNDSQKLYFNDEDCSKENHPICMYTP